MADELNVDALAALRKKRVFKKATYRGLELEALLDLSQEQLAKLLHARARRRIQRGFSRKQTALVAKLRKAKQSGEKVKEVKTHLRNMIILPEMVGSVVNVYNGKVFYKVDIKTDMVGYYLAEFSMSYNPVRHGRPGIGSTNSSRFIPLK